MRLSSRRPHIAKPTMPLVNLTGNQGENPHMARVMWPTRHLFETYLVPLRYPSGMLTDSWLHNFGREPHSTPSQTLHCAWLLPPSTTRYRGHNSPAISTYRGCEVLPSSSHCIRHCCRSCVIEGFGIHDKPLPHKAGHALCRQLLTSPPLYLCRAM